MSSNRVEPLLGRRLTPTLPAFSRRCRKARARLHQRRRFIALGHAGRRHRRRRDAMLRLDAYCSAGHHLYLPMPSTDCRHKPTIQRYLPARFLRKNACFPIFCLSLMRGHAHAQTRSCRQAIRRRKHYHDCTMSAGDCHYAIILSFETQKFCEHHLFWAPCHFAH